ncbi:unnamed protein product [Malus fusca]
MEQDLDSTSIQDLLAQLTAQLTHNAERTTMPSVPTLDVPYGQGYQSPQFSANEDVWGYQGYNQSRGNMFSNAWNSDWRGNSDYMWEEPQQFQQGGYWQQEDAFYSRPMQPPQHPPQQFQSNQSMPVDYNQMLEELISSVQGSQKEEQLPPSEEFYQWPYEPSHPPQQSTQFNSGTSLDNDTLNNLLTYLNQGVENQNQEMQDRVRRVDELDMHVGQIMEFMAQIQEQSEVSNSTLENSTAEVEIDEAITLEGDREDEVVPEPSKHSANMDELPLQEEDEDDDLGSLEEFLSQTPQVLMPSNSGEEVLSSIHSDIVPPNVLFPCRFLNPKEEVNEKYVVEDLPKVQSDIQILGVPNQVPDGIETFKETCTPRRIIPENEVAGEFVEYIKEDVVETTNAKEIEFDNKGHVYI